MQLRIFTLLIALCGTNLFLTAQYSEPEEQVSWIGAAEALFQSQEIIDSLVNWEERIYLHTDRLEAQAGDYIFFKAYAMTGPRKLRVSQSKVLRIDLLDSYGEVLNSHYYPLEAGMAGGTLPIPEDLEPDTYTIKAYTRWMQNYGKDHYFTRQIRINDKEGEMASSPALTQAVGVQFYPEGGQLIAGAQNKLVIRATDALGCPVSWKGIVRDNQGKTVSRLENYADGLGMISYTPESGNDYELALDNGSVFPFPKASEQGVALGVNSLESDRIRMRITRVGNNEKLYLVGKQADREIFSQQLEFQRNGQADLEIPKTSLPGGILTFEIRSEEGTAIASRPVRVEMSKALNLELLPTRQNLKQGGENEYTVKLTDAYGNPVQTEISLAITQKEQKSQLNLVDMLRPVPASSDVGVVRKSLFLEDLRLLASTDQEQMSTYPTAIEFPIQTGLELIGYVYDLNNELLRNTDIQVVSSTENALFLAEAKSDANGIIVLENLNLYGETALAFRTKGEDTKSRLVSFKPLHKEIEALENIDSEDKDKTRPTRKERKAAALIETTPWQTIDTTGLIQLTEAVVTAENLKQTEVPAGFGIKPTRVIKQDPEKPLPLTILMSRIPGVYTVPDPITGDPRIFVPRSWAFRGPILYVVDDFVLAPGMSPFDVVTMVDLDRVEVLLGPDAAIYGTRGAGAVFRFYTRSGAGLDYIRRKDGSIKFKGYEPQIDFEDYLTLRENNRKLRKQQPATLYWNPNIQTDENGEAVVRFTSPGDYQTVRVEAQALTQDGQPGVLNSTLKASND